MKKIVIIAFSIFTLISCSKSDSSNTSSSDNTLKISSVKFVPGTNSNSINYVITSFQAGGNGNPNSRFFILDTDIQSSAPESIQIEVLYPEAQTSINGTYSLDELPGDFNNYAQCAYSIGSNSYHSASGNVIISDLGNNKFKLEFDLPVTLRPDDTSLANKTLTGIYTGTFVVQN